MWEGFPLIPEQASTIAQGVDKLYYFLSAVSIFFSVLIFATIFYFAIRYRRRSDTEVPKPIHGSTALEIVWSVIPFCLVMVMFGWGASLYFTNSRAPEGAMTIDVVGKQWMWKLQHPEGHREINELHVPVGRPVRLVMTSEDVIHSFYVPGVPHQDGRASGALHHGLVPGHQDRRVITCSAPNTAATVTRGMIGKVVVMEPVAYEEWLSGVGAGESMAEIGGRMFTELRCDSCHNPDGSGRGPTLDDVFGHMVALQSGQTLVADEAYIRESILNPRAKVVAGFNPVMPTFQGQISEEQLLQLIAYVKSLSKPKAATTTNRRPTQ